jgi:hypothetical protein
VQHGLSLDVLQHLHEHRVPEPVIFLEKISKGLEIIGRLCFSFSTERAPYTVSNTPNRDTSQAPSISGDSAPRPGNPFIHGACIEAPEERNGVLC